MRSCVHSVVALALAFAAGASSASAQNPGLPVYNIGVPKGIGIYGDVGFPNAAAGKGTAYGLTGRVGFGALGVTATLSALDPEGSAGSDMSVGGTLNYKLLGGPLVPLSVTLQAGISYAKPGEGLLPDEEVTAYHYPIGLGFALVIPNPALAIHPWLAPRVDISRTSTNATGSTTETNFGLSGGLELNLLNGFGVQAAYDRVFLQNGDDPDTIGVGAHFSFRLPGL
jgi:hypothetical protein